MPASAAAVAPDSQDSRARHYAQLALEVTSAHAEASIETFRTMFGLFSTYDAAIALLSGRMARESLSVSTFNVLMLLAHGEFRRAGCPMHRLGELLLVSRANVTGLVDSLERKGLVERREHPHDRRSKLVRITPAGRERLARILPDHFRTLKQIVDALPPKDLERLWQLLGKLRASFEQAIAREADA